MKILNFGSLNIDHVYKVPHFVKKGETLSSEDLKQYPGGKGLNQSIALAKAGMSVWHAGVIGADGQFLSDILTAAGVHTELLHTDTKTPTGHAIIQNDVQGDNCILLYGGTNQQITTIYADEVLSHFGSGEMCIRDSSVIYPVRSGIGCVISSFGIVRIGSCVTEPVESSTIPARS